MKISMESKVSQMYAMFLVGAVMVLAALWLFATSMTEMVPFPPETTMEFVIIIFVVLGMNFGISSGKKLAYTIHDRDIILNRVEGQGKVTTMLGKIMSMPILFTATTTIIWIVFIIIVSLMKNIVVDSVIIGTVRWLMIIAMIILIPGSFLIYRAASYGKPHMLTLKGKIIMNKSSRVVAEAMEKIDHVEDRGREMVHNPGDAGRDLYHKVEDTGRDMMHQATDTGRDMAERVDDKGKDVFDRIRKKL